MADLEHLKRRLLYLSGSVYVNQISGKFAADDF